MNDDAIIIDCDSKKQARKVARRIKRLLKKERAKERARLAEAGRQPLNVEKMLDDLREFNIRQPFDFSAFGNAAEPLRNLERNVLRAAERAVPLIRKIQEQIERDLKAAAQAACTAARPTGEPACAHVVPVPGESPLQPVRVETMNAPPPWFAFQGDPPLEFQSTADSTPPAPTAPVGVLTPKQCTAWLRGDPGEAYARWLAPLLLSWNFITRGLQYPTQDFTYSARCRPSPARGWAQTDAQVTLRSCDLTAALEVLPAAPPATAAPGLFLLWIPAGQPTDETRFALLQRGYGGPGALVPVPSRKQLAAEEEALRGSK